MVLTLGYTLKIIYEVYHWVETMQYDPYSCEGELFAKYINTFFKFKQEASGAKPKQICPLTYKKILKTLIVKTLSRTLD